MAKYNKSPDTMDLYQRNEVEVEEEDEKRD